MINSLVFVSRKQVEQYSAAGNNAVISIRDPNKGVPRLPSSIGARIYLEFDDDTEYSVGLTPETVPDLMSGHEHGRRVMVNGNELCDYNDATKIFQFIEKIAGSSDITDLIVHCEMGISRSAAVAQFIHEYYGVPISNTNITADGKNRRLFRLLNKVAANADPITGELPEHCLNMRKTAAPKPSIWGI